MRFLQTFRGRLLLVLALLLIATLSVQFYLNLVAQNENNLLREEQSQALVSGIAIGFTGLTSSTERVSDIVARTDQPLMDDEARSRIIDIIIINSDWEITDSLNDEYRPDINADGEYINKRRLESLTDLPPLMEDNKLGADREHFPNLKTNKNKKENNEAHAIPIETSQGKWYVMVLLKNDRNEAAWRALSPLIITLAVLLISTLVTIISVWRFTRPIANLSDAARRVADGDLTVRVPEHFRTDELGQLSSRFNEMTSGLEKNRELEQQLQQAEKSAVIGRLGSAIAHEIRNPLNYINLTLDHLRSKFSPDDEAKKETFNKLTFQLKAEVARINSQITDFLNYSRPTLPNLRPMNVRESINESLRLVEGQAEENNIKISVVEHGEIPQIVGDPEFLRSVFSNLFINGVQAMGVNGGKLTITLEGKGEYVHISVADTGEGIPPENLEKIFEPYFSTKETGTGLGLAIVQKIIETHGGAITARSVPGDGTQFLIDLKVAE